MKKNLLYALLITAAFLVSCGDDEPDVNPIVGTWELDDVVISDPPAGFVIATNPQQPSVYGESEYLIIFNADGTYIREIERTAGDFEDEGTWEIDGDDLDLDQDDTNVQGLPTAFTIDGEISDRSMTLVTTDTWFAWPQSVIDSDTLPNVPTEQLEDFFEEFGALVEMTFTIDFDRQ